LSPVEARVARGIAERQMVEVIAETLGASRETMRRQIKSVFAKTGSKRLDRRRAAEHGLAYPSGNWRLRLCRPAQVKVWFNDPNGGCALMAFQV
jgi:DNA-binding NarL/FixJ family response regulator